MNEATQTLTDIIQKQFHQNQSPFEIACIVPIPEHGDRMVRLRALQEILDDLESTQTHPSPMTYLVQLKSRGPQPSPAPLHDFPSDKPNLETIYYPNGKLNIPFLMKNADLLFDAGDYTLARNIYKTILKSGEQTSSALHRLGRCFEAEGKLDEARASYEESIGYHPTLEAYQRLASLFIRQSKDAMAAEILERALNLKEIAQSLRFDLHKSGGNCWTRAQKPDEAEKHFKKALEINPAADEIRANLGALYLQSNKVSDAKKHFRDALASNPKNAQALAGLGSCCLADGDKKGAHDYFAQSLEIQLNNPTAIFYLVKCAYEIKSYATAARILSEYIQIAPVNTNLLYSLAGLQFHLGRILDAKSTTLKILELQSQHAGAKDLLGRIERYAGPPN